MADWTRATNKRKAAIMDSLGIPHNFKPAAERKPSGKPLEADVIRAVSELLATHPKVLWACRQNSGAASYEAKTGRYAPVYFYKILTRQDITITDFWGFMRDGRVFAIEAKRPGWKEAREPREFKQAAFLLMVRNMGGIGGFVTSLDEANALLAQ